MTRVCSPLFCDCEQFFLRFLLFATVESSIIRKASSSSSSSSSSSLFLSLSFSLSLSDRRGCQCSKQSSFSVVITPFRRGESGRTLSGLSRKSRLLHRRIFRLCRRVLLFLLPPRPPPRPPPRHRLLSVARANRTANR